MKSDLCHSCMQTLDYSVAAGDSGVGVPLLFHTETEYLGTFEGMMLQFHSPRDL